MGPIKTWQTGENRPDAGLTLIELIAALAIAALIAGLTVGALRPAKPGALMRNTGFELAAILRQARSQAQMSNEPHSVIFDLKTKRYAVRPAGANGPIPAELALIVRTSLTEAIAQDRAAIRFYPDGSSSGGEISLQFGASVQIIRVNWLSGHVSVETIQTLNRAKP